jgi:hypothetical protein
MKMPLLKRHLKIVEHNEFVPDHQFSFRERHSTIEQTHRIINELNEALENNQYCSAAFLGISQAFDNIWHTGLLYKFRLFLPLDYFILQNHICRADFLVKFRFGYTELTPVKTGVHQGSVLLYTAELPPSTESKPQHLPTMLQY